MTARCEDDPRQSLFVLTFRQLSNPIYSSIRPRFDGRLADEKYGAASAARILRRREIRNNSGLKYNECDLKYITSATFPSRPRAYLFRLFCSCRARRLLRARRRSRAGDLSLLITWFELEIVEIITLDGDILAASSVPPTAAWASPGLGSWWSRY